jgi:hypothetical protein
LVAFYGKFTKQREHSLVRSGPTDKTLRPNITEYFVSIKTNKSQTQAINNCLSRDMKVELTNDQLSYYKN